jgi:hypothetical protein
MDNVTLSDKDNIPFVADTFTRDVAGTPVHMQAVVPVDPLTGEPNSATEATLSALKAATDALLAVAQAMNAKLVQVDTQAVSLTQDSISSLGNESDTVIALLSLIAEKMPRLDRTDRMTVDLTDYPIGGNLFTYSPVNCVSNPFNGSFYFRSFEPFNFSDAGCTRLYNQIQVA